MFDPNAAAQPQSGIFGLPYNEADSAVVFLPVPWEATTSYGGGTSRGPAAILEASRQIDLFDLEVLRPYLAGLYLLPTQENILAWNEEAQSAAEPIVECGGETGGNPDLVNSLARVNHLGEKVNEFVHRESKRILSQGKILGVVGGDHSVPFGAFQAAAEKFGSYGILHFDAHADLRSAYEGFTWSHASIMYNTLGRIPEVTRLVQVGIRDVCEQEMEYARSEGDRIRTFFDADLAKRRFDGVTWSKTAAEIVAALPEQVWISFDIDGLDPRFCPHTGTPVPGGLDFNEANAVIGMLARSGRRIVGFDLNEVAPDIGDPEDQWDANVGARLLYKLTAWTLFSQGKAKLRS